MSLTRRVIRITGIVFVAVAIAFALALGVLFALSEARINRVYAVPTASLTMPTDTAYIAEGERLTYVRGCVGCHGDGLGGRPLMSVTGFAYLQLPSLNLTRGVGGVGAQLSDADWERAIRHGVGHDGRGLWLMPSDSTWNLSDGDTAAMIAYLKQLPPVDNALPQKGIGLLFRGLTLAGQFPLLSAERIDHAAPRPVVPPAAPTVEFGAYMAQPCSVCHGTGFSGGPLDGQPDAPHAANLTPSGGLSGWQEEWFVTALRSGVLPGGRQMEDHYMPWKSTARMTDTEIEAVWLYLKSLPPRQTGTK